MHTINRRNMLRASAVTCFSAAASRCGIARKPLRKTTVAAVQYAPVLGDVDANLARAEHWIRQAAHAGAEWVVLPEFFTSGLAMHPLMFSAPRPIDGQPFKFLVKTAQELGIYLGGSFLAKLGKDVFNTFILASPDGTTASHDKDFPSTNFESSFYAGGEDQAYAKQLRDDGFETLAELIPSRKENRVNGVLSAGPHNVGVAMCWELVRYRTTRRLFGKIDLLLGASGWWWLTPEFDWPGSTRDESARSRELQLELIREAPKHQARMLGVPVVNANFVGINPSLSSTAFDAPATGRYLGQSQIVDHTGESLELLGEKDEGFIAAEVELGDPQPSEPIPDAEFWLPELDVAEQKGWSRSGAQGRDYYLKETRRRIDK